MVDGGWRLLLGLDLGGDGDFMNVRDNDVYGIGNVFPFSKTGSHHFLLVPLFFAEPENVH